MKRSINQQQNLVIFRLATCCGLRVSEICGLTIRNVKLQAGRPHLFIPKEIAKGKKSRRVPLWWDAGTLEDISKWREERREMDAHVDDPFVVCLNQGEKYGEEMTRQACRERFKTAVRTALGKDRADGATIHHGRHSFVSHALAGGRNLAEVRDAAGHANISITSAYTHVVGDDDEVGDLFNFSSRQTRRKS